VIWQNVGVPKQDKKLRTSGSSTAFDRNLINQTSYDDDDLFRASILT
jgi:hypothetical protein